MIAGGVVLGKREMWDLPYIWPRKQKPFTRDSSTVQPSSSCWCTQTQEQLSNSFNQLQHDVFDQKQILIIIINLSVLSFDSCILHVDLSPIFSIKLSLLLTWNKIYKLNNNRRKLTALSSFQILLTNISAKFVCTLVLSYQYFITQSSADRTLTLNAIFDKLICTLSMSPQESIIFKESF